MAEGGEQPPPNEAGKVPPPSQDESLEYGDIHKLVLQGLMSAGFLDNKGVKRLFVGACSYLNRDPEEMTKMSFVQKVVRGINDKIKQFDMAIRSASCELTGKKYYVFLLTVEKPILKMQTLYTKFQADLFQVVMDAILRKYNNFSVPLTECINLSLEVDSKANLEVAERFLLKMIDQNYLTKMTFGSSRDDYNVTLGFRGIREFEPMFREVYCDVVSTCCFCKMILLHGYVCRGCQCHVHRPCYAKLIPSTRQCPNCAQSWEDPSSMKPRVRYDSGQEQDDQQPGTSREAMAELRKQQQLAAQREEEVNTETLDAEGGQTDDDDTGNQDEEEEGDTQDIEGETDGVVTRDSDNDDEDDEDQGTIPELQFENLEVNPPSVRATRRRGKRVYDSSDSE